MAGLDRETFLLWLTRDVAANLEKVVGVEGAKGYLSLVGDDLGRRIDDLFRAERGGGDWDIGEVADVLVELKARIGGQFEVTALTGDTIEFVNSRCPFGDNVHGRPSLCMMTSNVFGRIAATHLGYAAVTLDETIAAGHGRCVVRVVTDADRPVPAEAREYFGEDADRPPHGPPGGATAP